MKYHLKIDIEAPLDFTVKCFQNDATLKNWQKEFVQKVHLDGMPNQKGVKYRLDFKTKARSFSLVEELMKLNLPNEINFKYSTKSVVNYMNNTFETTTNHQTVWHTENEFQFKGLFALFAPFIKASFPKQTIRTMEAFKEFVESEYRK